MPARPAISLLSVDLLKGRRLLTKSVLTLSIISSVTISALICAVIPAPSINHVKQRSRAVMSMPALKPKSSDVLPPSSMQGLLAGRQQFSKFSALIKQAGLTGRWARSQNQTFFLPTNQALSQEEGVFEALLLSTSRRQLRSILDYSSVPGQISQKQLKAGAELSSSPGERLRVSRYKSTIWINDAHLISAPLRLGSNTVYLIDMLLMAPGQEPG